MLCPKKGRAPARSGLALAVMSACCAFAHAQQPRPTELQSIEVVGTTPVPGVGIPKDQVPANVQTATDKDFRRSQAQNLPDFLNTQLPSVNVNEIQGNPYQMDVNYRGFTASPLLGTPQGLSVYVDGVRVNEPFGDVVNWDLIPKAALSSITLMPGSNPLFGLNTLGGALSLQTKSGDTHPGTEIEVSWGSFRRSNVEVSHGSKLGGGMHVFIAASDFEERGWRDFSPSRVRQAFGKIGQRGERFEWDLGLHYASASLIGNGALPETMYAQRESQIYTRPDQTRNEMFMGTFNGTMFLGDSQKLSLLLYHRKNRTSTLNGDVNDAIDEDQTSTNGFLSDKDGNQVQPGVENRTHTRQTSEGGALQWTLLSDRNQLTVGASHDRAKSAFRQTEEAGEFDATRGVIPGGDLEVENVLSGRTRTSSLYLTDTLSVLPNLQLTMSGRFNHTTVKTIDQLNPGVTPNLDGDFTYNKFNPAIGLTWQASKLLTVYGGFNQGNRAPSPIELGCADPANPCTLPNALQSDPYLKQVIARTLELGVRGKLGEGLRWNAGVFRTNNTDDILFVGSATAASQGYFTNFGKTRREGVELGLSGNAGMFDWGASYSYVKATFRSSACIVSPNNSTRNTSANCTPDPTGSPNDQIEVQSGNRIPGIPEHSLKLELGVKPVTGLRVATNVVAYSDQFARGNENNAHKPDGTTYNGSGKVGGFMIVNLAASYALGGGWELFAKVNNLFDRRYQTGGLLGENAFNADGSFNTTADWPKEQFVAPGAPRAGWIGVRYAFGGKGD